VPLEALGQLKKSNYLIGNQTHYLPACKAVPSLKLLLAGIPLRRPGFASGQHVGFVVGKTALGQVFSEYFGFRRQSFHQSLQHHNHLGLAQ
jgi:hypothetical protein